MSKVKCLKCKKVKDDTEFYRIYSGYMNKRCKACIAIINKEKTLEIKRKKKNAIRIF